MPRVILTEHDGTRHDIATHEGQSVLHAALDNGVPGLLGDCGGYLGCATCHGYVGAAWADRLAPPGDEELALLEGVVDRRETSRLTCQIILTPELDGLSIDLPSAQY